MAVKFTFETTLERGEDSLELRVTYGVSAYYPETRLQPAEGGEVEILEAKFIGTDAASLPALLTDAEYETLQTECEERAQQDAEDAALDRADWKYEQRRDRTMEERDF